MRRVLAIGHIGAVAIALASPAADASPEHHGEPGDRIDVVLRGAGVVVSLPRRQGGTWSARPRFDTRPDWRPDDSLKPGDVLAVSELTFATPVPGAPVPAEPLSAQIRLGTRDCSSHADGEVPGRPLAVAGWSVQWDPGEVRSRAEGCHALPGGRWLKVSVLYSEASGESTAGRFTAAQIGGVLGAIAAAFDEARVAAEDRPLADPDLARKGAGVTTLTLPHSGLVVDLARAGQVLAVLDPADDGLLRVLPFFPQTSYSVLVNEQVPGDRSCPRVFELARGLRGGTATEVTSLPRRFVQRRVLRQGASTIVCEDFAGGVQLVVDLLADAPADAVVSSNAPLLAELHRAVARAHRVEAIAIGADLTPPAPRPVPLRQRAGRALGRGGFLAGLAGIYGEGTGGGELRDTPGTAGVRITYAMRKHLTGVLDAVGYTDVDLGAGLGGGFAYDLYVAPYGLGVGSHHVFVGLAPGAGLSGLTGGRLDLSWQLGVRATAGISVAGYVAQLHARTTFVTGDQRQNGAPWAPVGDEVTAGLDVIRFGTGRHPIAVGLRYREARRTRFIGATLSFGIGASAE